MARSSQTWDKGESGNPRGRPKGRSTRRELAESFLRVVRSRWEREGAACIDDMIRSRPHDFVRLVAKLMPQDVRVRLDEEQPPLLVIENPHVGLEHGETEAESKGDPAPVPQLPNRAH